MVPLIGKRKSIISTIVDRSLVTYSRSATVCLCTPVIKLVMDIARWQLELTE